MRLQDKIILITGSGSGIGKSTALLFATEGAVVVVNDLNEKNGNETVEEIKQRGGQALFIKADVTKSVEFESMINQIIQKFGRIDVLFNNAGISGVGAVHELSEEVWDRVINVNVKGVFLPSKYVLPYMERKEGNIINMSSCIAEIGLMKRTVYAASKGAVLALTKSTQTDYALYNIRVNALLPGTMFLASNESKFMMGSPLYVDGGVVFGKMA